MIAQGVEAGGHVRGTVPATELLARIRRAMSDAYPVLSAGGIADASDVAARLDAGAEAVICGTRFLMTEESGAHAVYKARLIEAEETVLTELFGVGWPAAHRVLPNEATLRWLGRDPRAAPAGYVRSIRPLLRSCLEFPCRCSFGWQRHRSRAGRCTVPPLRPSTDLRTS